MISAGTTRWSIEPKVINWGQRACGQWANGGNGNVPFLLTWCQWNRPWQLNCQAHRSVSWRKKIPEDSLSACVMNVDVGTPQDYRFLWTKHAVKKKQDGTRLRVCVAEKVHQEENKITRCCIFLMNTFPAKIALIVSLYCIKSDWNKNTQQSVARFVLSYAILMKPQSHYKISQINTALDHKHDTDNPPLPSPSHQKLASCLKHHVRIYIYIYMYFLHFKILVLWEHSKQTYSWIN